MHFVLPSVLIKGSQNSTSLTRQGGGGGGKTTTASTRQRVQRAAESDVERPAKKRKIFKSAKLTRAPLVKQ